MKLNNRISLRFCENLADEQYACAYDHARHILRCDIGSWPLEDTRSSEKATPEDPAA